MYLVTMKKHAYCEEPLRLCKELYQAKDHREQIKLGWGDVNPIKLYKISLEEITPSSDATPN